MKIALLALGAGLCFAQSTIQTQTNGFWAGGPVAAKIVTGRPFTAEAFVETDQTLADGSHVVSRQTVTAARDSQGRAHREKVLSAPTMGSSASKGIFINPLAVVTERLYLHDLEATVLAKRSDPRVFAGYTVEEDSQ
jgi:hypothetical protein